MSLGYSRCSTTRKNFYLRIKRNKGSWDHQQKRHIYALIASEKDILSRIAGLKEVEKKAKAKAEKEIQVQKEERERKSECSQRKHQRWEN